MFITVSLVNNLLQDLAKETLAKSKSHKNLRALDVQHGIPLTNLMSS